MSQTKHSPLNRIRPFIILGLTGALTGAGVGRLASSATTDILFWAVIGSVIGILFEIGLRGLHWMFVIYEYTVFKGIICLYGLASLWLMSIPAFVWGGYVAQASYRAWFGHDQAYPLSGVITNIGLCGLVVTILYGIIRPWSFHYSIGRLAISLILLIGCFAFVATPFVDPPGFQSVQVLWLLLVMAVLFIALALAVRARRETLVQSS